MTKMSLDVTSENVLILTKVRVNLKLYRLIKITIYIILGCRGSLFILKCWDVCGRKCAQGTSHETVTLILANYFLFYNITKILI